MKKLSHTLFIGYIFCMIMFIGTSCIKKTNNRNNSSRYDRYKVEVQPKHKKGDVVYLKPDSLKVVVFEQCPCSKTEYDVYWFDKTQKKQVMTVSDELIF